MTTTTGAAFHVHAIPADGLRRLREPNRTTVPSHAGGGESLRCCLRAAEPGEEVLLVGYEPPLPPSPYRETGAVFVHAARCSGPTGTGYPADWRGRPQVLRAYDRHGHIHPATRVHDGHDPESAIRDVLADPAVVEVHSRNVAYGCFMFKILRE
jgi:hypothetical protein